MAPPKILVVDDNVELAENLAEIIQVMGYEAIVEPSAEAALQRIAAGGVSAVVTDFRLPGLSGADLIRELRRSGSALPVVVMSAYSDASMVERAEAAGALEVMTKPVDVAKLPKHVPGAFIAIGHDPQSQLVHGQVEIDPAGYVVTQGRSTLTNVRGVFAAALPIWPSR